MKRVFKTALVARRIGTLKSRIYRKLHHDKQKLSTLKTQLEHLKKSSLEHLEAKSFPDPNQDSAKSVSKKPDSLRWHSHEKLKEILQKSEIRKTDKLPDLEKFDSLINSELNPQK
jgi:hypothetical protein